MNELKLEFPALDEIKNQLEKLNEMLFFVHENNLPKFLPMETVEQLFLVTKQTLNKLAKEGKLNKFKLSDRKIYFATEEIYALIEQNQVKEFRPKQLKK